MYNNVNLREYLVIKIYSSANLKDEIKHKINMPAAVSGHLKLAFWRHKTRI